MQLVFPYIKTAKEELKMDFQHVQAVVTTIRNSQVLCQKLVDLQSRKPPLQLIAPVATRWNSQFYMLERFVTLIEPLSMMALEEDKKGLWGNVFNTGTLDRLRSYVPLLKPLEAFTSTVEGNYVTISIVPYLLHTLLNDHLIKQPTDSSIVKKLKKQIKASIKERMGWILEGPSLPLLGAALDPRYGHLSFVDIEIRESVWSQLALEGFEEMKPITSGGLPTIELDDIKYHLEKVRKHFEAHIAPSSSDPLKFWEEYKPGHVLLPIVQMVLSVPASSAAVERGFSNSGFLMSGRENLTLDHVEQLAVVCNYLQSHQYNFVDLCKLLQTQ
jgi:hypothetical protein